MIVVGVRWNHECMIVVGVHWNHECMIVVGVRLEPRVHDRGCGGWGSDGEQGAEVAGGW